jgi:hypothetical protein
VSHTLFPLLVFGGHHTRIGEQFAKSPNQASNSYIRAHERASMLTW